LAVKLTKTPELSDPVLLACWPGIGNIGLLAVESICETLNAEEFGYIEPWEFFYPKKVIIRDGLLIGLEFPASRFYYKRTEKRDIVIFIGEEQPVWDNKPYAEGMKAYQMANLVVDVARDLGCRHIFTSGAAVTSIHHTMKSRVWAVPNTKSQIPEIKKYQNTVLMSEVDGVDGQGTITGLNGLLLGVAAKRGIDAMCIMGEIPVYLQGLPVIYPKASKSVLEVLSAVLHIDIDMTRITQLSEKSEREINLLYEKLPQEAKSQLEELKKSLDARTMDNQITEEDKKKIVDDVDNFFKNKGYGGAG
jgi:proteasome assembly chaperone (PAC2) family protein